MPLTDFKSLLGQLQAAPGVAGSLKDPAPPQ